MIREAKQDIMCEECFALVEECECDLDYEIEIKVEEFPTCKEVSKQRWYPQPVKEWFSVKSDYKDYRGEE